MSLVTHDAAVQLRLTVTTVSIFITWRVMASEDETSGGAKVKLELFDLRSRVVHILRPEIGPDPRLRTAESWFWTDPGP